MIKYHKVQVTIKKIANTGTYFGSVQSQFFLMIFLYHVEPTFSELTYTTKGQLVIGQGSRVNWNPALLVRAGFQLATSGYWTAAVPIELSSQLGTVCSLYPSSSSNAALVSFSN